VDGYKNRKFKSKNLQKNVNLLGGFIILGNYMRHFKKLIICLVLLLFSYGKSVQAVPANSEKRVFEQPNGESFTASLYGDERVNYLVAEDGSVLKKDKDSYWCYSNMKYGKIVPLNKKYKLDSAPVDKLTSTNMSYKLQMQKPLLATESIKPISKVSSTPPSSQQNVLVILTQFNDVKLTYSARAWYDTIFNPSTKSMNNFYKQSSFNKLNFLPAQESEGTVNDGIVTVSLNYNHPNYGGDLDGIDYDLQQALLKTNNYVDFKVYDKNGDGKLVTDELHIIFVFAGQEASAVYQVPYAYEPSIWAHKSNIMRQFSLDGINFYNEDYLAIGEKHEDHKATMGVICHEVGHSLGLPDLYDIDYSSSGVGEHSLMASGSWGYVANEYPGQTPTDLDPWSKIYLGFMQPELINYDIDATVNSMATGKYNILKVITRNPQEYFLIENRQPTGYDEALRNFGINSGIAIWHINEAVIEAGMYTNEVNSNDLRRGVDLEEANEGSRGLRQLDLRPEQYAWERNLEHYFTKSKFSLFSSDTTPNSKLDFGYSSEITINIRSDSSASMNLKVTGGYFMDFDNDGYINIKDLGNAAKLYNVSSNQSSYERRMDVNGDGIIDIYDLVKVSLGFM